MIVVNGVQHYLGYVTKEICCADENILALLLSLEENKSQISRSVYVCQI